MRVERGRARPSESQISNRGAVSEAIRSLGTVAAAGRGNFFVRRSPCGIGPPPPAKKPSRSNTLYRRELEFFIHAAIKLCIHPRAFGAGRALPRGERAKVTFTTRVFPS